MSNRNLFRKFVQIVVVTLLCAASVFAQGGRRDSIAFKAAANASFPQFASGVNIAVCSGLATTAASVSGNVVTLTFASSPIAAGFTVNSTAIVYQFAGADAYLNGSFTITAVTASTITYNLTHANATATSVGNVVQQGNSTTACLPLASLWTDATLTVASANPIVADALGNYGYWTSPGVYQEQTYGSGTTISIKAVTISCVGGAAAGSCGAQLGANNAFTGNNTHSGTETFAKLNAAVHLDGVTNPQTCAGLQGILASNAHIVIPPNVTVSTSASCITGTSLTNVLLEGSGDSSVLALTGTTSINGIAVSGTVSGTSNLNANSPEGSTTVTLVAGGAASIGAVAGSYFKLADSAVSPGPNYQVGRITSVAGDIITIDEPIFVPGGFTTANSSTMVIMTSPSQGVRIRNLTIDATGNTGASTNAVQLNFCVNCEVSNVTIKGATGWGVEAETGHTNAFHDIMILASGNGGSAAFDMFRQTHASFANIQIEHLPPNAFGFTFHWVNDSAASNLILNHTQSGGGRGFKLANTNYSLWSNVIVESVATGFNGISLTLSSSHNKFENCQSLANSGAGIGGFGTQDKFNSFVNCTSKFNAGGQISAGATDDNWQIIGGEYGNARAAALVASIQSNDFKIIGVKFSDDNGQATGGLGFSATSSNGAVIGNSFSGFPAGQDINNVLTTNTVFAFNSTPDGVSRAGATNSWYSNIGDAAGLSLPEGTAPSGLAATDQLWPDSTAHRWKMLNNNGAAKTVAFLESDTFTSPTVNLLTNGTGLQVFNTTTTCTTAATAGATCTTAAISLPAAEADTSYRVSCTGKGPTAVPTVVATTNSSATQFTITIAAITAVAASYASYDCVAGHN